MALSPTAHLFQTDLCHYARPGTRDSRETSTIQSAPLTARSGVQTSPDRANGQPVVSASRWRIRPVIPAHFQGPNILPLENSPVLRKFGHSRLKSLDRAQVPERIFTHIMFAVEVERQRPEETCKSYTQYLTPGELARLTEFWPLDRAQVPEVDYSSRFAA